MEEKFPSWISVQYGPGAIPPEKRDESGRKQSAHRTSVRYPAQDSGAITNCSTPHD